MLLEKIEDLLKEVDNLKAQNAEDVEKLRLKYLSKKGEINAIMADFRNVAADQKKTVGIKINELKKNAQEKINQLREQVQTKEADGEELDLTRTIMVLRSTMTSTSSPCSILLPTIPHATCRTRSSSSSPILTT